MKFPIKFKIAVQCLTFNHSKYIVDALDGFSCQETDFPFVCIIVDDFSTDGNQDIIRRYLDSECNLKEIGIPVCKETEDYILVYAHHAQNVNCFFVVYFLKFNHFTAKRSKSPYFYNTVSADYYAICEGDDFWTSPDKLQIQVDFLESHKDYSMCFHKVEILTEDPQRLGAKLYSDLQEKEYSGNEIISRWIVPTCSVVFSSGIYKYLPHDNDFCVGDNVLFLTAASRGRCFCMNRTMGVYRRSISGWTANNRGTMDSEYKMIKHMKALLRYFPQYKQGIYNPIALRYVRITFYQLKDYNLSFIKTFFTGLYHYHFYYLKYLFVKIIKRFEARINKHT